MTSYDVTIHHRFGHFNFGIAWPISVNVNESVPFCEHLSMYTRSFVVHGHIGILYFLVNTSWESLPRMLCANFPNIIRCLLHPSGDGRSASGKSKKPRFINTGHKRREDRAATVPVGSPSGSVSIFISSAWFN
jgi:hypothetical protein